MRDPEYKFQAPAALPTTLQEWFDIASVHLVRQGDIAEGINGGCKYRTYDGRACAIGACIPEDVYNPVWDDVELLSPEDPLYEEATTYDCLVKYGYLQPTTFDTELRELQVIHDAEQPSTWPSQLLEYAIKHKLSAEALHSALADMEARGV